MIGLKETTDDPICFLLLCRSAGVLSRRPQTETPRLKEAFHDEKTLLVLLCRAGGPARAELSDYARMNAGNAPGGLLAR